MMAGSLALTQETDSSAPFPEITYDVFIRQTKLITLNSLVFILTLDKKKQMLFLNVYVLVDEKYKKKFCFFDAIYLLNNEKELIKKLIKLHSTILLLLVEKKKRQEKKIFIIF